MLTRRQFIGGCVGFAAAGAGLFAYTAEVEPFWPQFERRQLPVRDLPSKLAGAMLVHLSDIHVGGRVPDSYVLDSFERIAELKPDIIVVTGDLTQASSSSHAESVYAHLPHGRLATVCTLGNHDYGRAWSEPAKADSLAGAMSVEGLQVVGMDDLWAGRFDPAKAFASADAGMPTICLSHNPDTADLAGWGSFDGWILAGHTHGGQCKPPFLPPPQLPVNNRRYTSGEFQLSGGRRMYISRGLGFLRQVRFNARPEVTVFELVNG
jgi:predicted MPP superfamily phosphohydrolase